MEVGLWTWKVENLSGALDPAPGLSGATGASNGGSPNSEKESWSMPPGLHRGVTEGQQKGLGLGALNLGEAIPGRSHVSADQNVTVFTAHESLRIRTPACLPSVPMPGLLPSTWILAARSCPPGFREKLTGPGEVQVCLWD